MNKPPALAISCLLLCALLTSCLPTFARIDPETSDLESLPLGEWVALPLEEPALAADGSPYELDVKRGASGNLIIYFAGGGAAWDADSAFQPFTFQSLRKAERTGSDPGFYFGRLSRLTPLLMAGILDSRRNDNPFVDWTIAYLPYTTGDLHLGDSVVEYERDGKRRTLRYNGYHNTLAALDWVTQAVPAPQKLLVAGQSAGGFAAAAWFDRIAEFYPDAELFQYSDSSFLYSERGEEIARDVWNARLTERFGLGSATNVLDSALRLILDKYGPRVTVLHSETVADGVLPWFEAHLNGQEPDVEYRRGWSERMLATVAALHAEYPNFYLYLTDYGLQHEDSGGFPPPAKNFFDTGGASTAHTLSQSESFHDTSEEGVSLADWLAAAVLLRQPRDVGLDWLQ